MARPYVARLIEKHGLSGDTRPLAAVLVLVVALNAAGAMIVEIVAGRLLAPYFGMSLYSWTTVIGVVLTGLALGHWLGGRLADAHPGHRRALLGLACLAGAATTVLVLPLVAIAAGVADAFGLPPAGGVLVTGFVAFLLPSVAAGLVQPIATTFGLEALGAGAGRTVGRMLAAGVVGAIAGTFLAGFVLVAYLGSAGAIWLVAAVNALLAALLLAAGRLRLAGIGGFLVAGGFAATGAAPPLLGTPCEQESAYYCISVLPGERIDLPGARLMRLDALPHSLNAPDPARLEFSHLQLVDELVRARLGDRPFASFLVGGGGYTLPRAWLARDPANAVTVAELDPLVTEIAMAEMWFAPGSATRVLHEDARVALARAPGDRRYDVIVGDAFRDIAVPVHLVTDEFHALVRERLAPEGFYVLNVIDAVGPRRLASSIARTLEERFAVVEMWVETAEVQTSDFANFLVYASAVPSGLASPFRSVTEPVRRFERTAARAMGEAGVVRLTDDYAPVERLMLDHWFFGR
jgi:MFS family permease